MVPTSLPLSSLHRVTISLLVFLAFFHPQESFGASSEGAFTPISGMPIPRSGHIATLLHDGKVLIVSGETVSRAAELYDPSTRTFSRTGNMATIHTNPAV